MRVYLAGNMVTDWRDEVIKAVPGIEFISPARGDDWFERQCEQMEAADMCFAYIDTTARHIGTVAELSAFRVMEKPRILVMMQERREDRGYVIAEKMASPDFVTSDMQEAIGWLQALAGRR